MRKQILDSYIKLLYEKCYRDLKKAHISLGIALSNEIEELREQVLSGNTIKPELVEEYKSYDIFSEPSDFERYLSQKGDLDGGEKNSTRRN